jgi:hypothetical protein
VAWGERGERGDPGAEPQAAATRSAARRTALAPAREPPLRAPRQAGVDPAVQVAMRASGPQRKAAVATRSSSSSLRTPATTQDRCGVSWLLGGIVPPVCALPSRSGVFACWVADLAGLCLPNQAHEAQHLCIPSIRRWLPL